MERLSYIALALLIFACDGTVDVSPDGSVDAGNDGGRSDIPVSDVPTGDVPVSDGSVVPGLPFCVEVEDLEVAAGAQVWPAHATTNGGVVILDPDNTGRIEIPFALATDADVALWFRIRAPTHANNSVHIGLDGLDAEPGDETSWDVPITPVLSWQRVFPRGNGEEWRPENQTWPGSLSAGEHSLIVSGREPNVELDAFCVTAADARPLPRYIAPPEHSTVIDLDEFGIAGDGETDDTDAIRAALGSLSEGETLRLPAGRFRTTDALPVQSSNVTVEGTLGPAGERLTTLYFDHPNRSSNGSTGGIVVVGAGHGDASPLRQDALPLQRTIVVDAAAEFAVGDLVVVDSDPWGPDNPDLVRNGREVTASFRHLRARGEIMERTEADGLATLVLNRPFLESFTMEHNSRVSLYQPRQGVVIRNLRLEGTQRQLGDDDTVWDDDERARNADINLVRMRRVAHSFVYNLEILHFRDRGVLLNDCLDIQMFDNEIHDSTDFDGGGRGYGALAEMSQGIDFYRNELYGVMRHSLSFTNGVSESTMTDNNMTRGTDETEPMPPHVWACIDIHGQYSYGLLIARNTTLRGEYGVIIGGGFGSHGNDGPWIVVRDNVHEGHFGGGVGTNDNSHDAVFENNRLVDNRRGVHIFINSDRTYVWNNTIEGSTQSGILVEDSDETQVFGNMISGDVAAMTLDDDCDGYVIRQNDVGGGAINEPGNGTVE